MLDTLTVMQFVFRLVFARSRQIYATTVAERWAQCPALEVTRPQPQPVSDAALSKARPQLEENVCMLFHVETLRRADQPGPQLRGHRLVAVDGCQRRLNLWRPYCCAGGPISARLPSTFARGPGRAAASAARTTRIGDTPRARPRYLTCAVPQPHSGPDADTAGKRNGRELAACGLKEPSIVAQTPQLVRDSKSQCHHAAPAELIATVLRSPARTLYPHVRAPARTPLMTEQLRCKACVYRHKSSDFKVRHHFKRHREPPALAAIP